MNKSILNQEHWQEMGRSYNNVWDRKSRAHMNAMELGFVSKYLKQTNGTNVLDVGVGTGRIIESHTINGHAKNIYGVDIASQMVDYCLKKYEGTKLIKSILTLDLSKSDLPFTVRFDFISAIRVLKYNREWKVIVRKLANSLNDNGIFVFTMPNINSLTRFSKYPIPIYQTTFQEIQIMCEAYNLEVLEITSFTKIPDIFYDLNDNNMYISLLTFLESSLRQLLGGAFFGRIFFIAVRKKV